MRAPVWFPQSVFARTLWLVLVVVLFSKALTLLYLLANEDMLVDRQYSHGTALTVRAWWAADPAARARIAESTGLRQLVHEEVPAGEHHWPYTEVFEAQMRVELGEDAQVRMQAHRSPRLWVLAPQLGPDWVEVPLYPYPLKIQRIWSVLGWFLAIGLLSTAAAWIFVRLLSQPINHLIAAARQIGRGRRVRLPVSDTPSEMTELYRAFNQMAEDLEQAGRERELMLAGVSHDLRTPLTRLRLSLELLPADDELTEDMVRDIEDMNAILDQFLSFTRDGRDEPLEASDLNELVREVARPHNQQEEQVRLCLEPLPSMPLRRVSCKRLLANLLENALRYGGDGVEVCTSLAGAQSAPYVVLSVLDRGPGIDPAQIDSLFTPFTRGDRARSSKGTGLGLAIVKRIAAQHGGSVELRNRAGGGMEARVCLPLGLLLPRDAA